MNYKKMLLLFILLGSFSVNAQEDINKVNSKGERIGVWKKYHPNHRIRYVGRFVNGKEVGTFKYYSIVSSDHPIAVKVFSKENSIAQVTFYTEKGVMESNGKMDGKNRIGKWYYYQEDGEALLAEENYKNGVLEGESKSFYRNGNMAELMNYKNGVLDGVSKRFSDEEILLDEVNYVAGKLNGLAKYYNLKGELIYTGPYENDEKVGEWKFYMDGELADPNDMKQ